MLKWNTRVDQDSKGSSRLKLLVKMEKSQIIYSMSMLTTTVRLSTRPITLSIIQNSVTSEGRILQEQLLKDPVITSRNTFTFEGGDIIC